MTRYLDPRSDVVFKKIFGDHPHLFKHFLNAILPLPDNHQIVSLEYLTPKQTPEIPTFKSTNADVKCKDEKGNVFIVEIQMDWTNHFMYRLHFKAAQAYVKQLNAGEDYHLLNPVYGLALVDAIFDKETEEWYHHYGLVKLDNPTQQIIKGLNLVFVELPKFKANTNPERNLKTLWLRFMLEINPEADSVDEALLEVPEIKEAISLAKKSVYKPWELDYYESFWREVSSERTIKRDREEEGKIEGKREAQLEIALALKGQGLSIEQIALCTKLPQEEVEKLLGSYTQVTSKFGILALRKPRDRTIKTAPILQYWGSFDRSIAGVFSLPKTKF